MKIFQPPIAIFAEMIKVLPIQVKRKHFPELAGAIPQDRNVSALNQEMYVAYSRTTIEIAR